MLKGPDALNSLDEALRDIRREEDEISKRLSRSGERVSKIRETEAELFRQLAHLRLDPAVHSQLQGAISQAETRARELFRQHNTDLGAAEAALKTSDAQIAALTQQRATILAELDQRQAELKALSARISAATVKDLAYARQRNVASEMAEIAAQSMSKTQQSEADREQKGRPYRDDPLFMYLWNRNYGTSTYRAGNVARWLDGMVANLVGYAKARPNFAMLNEIPLRLREHAERQAANATEAEKQLDVLENAAIDAAGGQAMREALTAAQTRIEAIDARMVEAEDDRDDKATAFSTLAQGGDTAFNNAVSAMAEGLGREDLQSLLAEARRTSTAQDDTIVAQIDDARSRAREEDAEMRDLKARLKTLAARRRELEDIQWEFKKARFDDPRSTFREDRLVGDLLNDFLRGGITAASYWEQWRRSQNWSAGTSDWGGGIGLPHNGRSQKASPWAERGGGFQWPDTSIGGKGGSGSNSGGGFGGAWGQQSSGGGGFSRPRTGSSGSRKSGGGFKTGGGF